MAVGVQVVIDCADPARVAAFWAAALGYKLDDPPDGYPSWEEFLREQGVPEDQWNSASAVTDPDGAGPRIYFQRVPEPKTLKNRVHLDLNVGGGSVVAPEERRAQIDAAAERLIGLGARKLWPKEERGEFWIVMADPEGNEFCLP